MDPERKHSPIAMMICLVFAGEAIFSLPFHIPRYFRPTFLSALSLSNADLGDVFSAYGITAMLAYFPGGFLADRFSPRWLMSFSLWATAAGGIPLMWFPTVATLKILFAYWGLTTILMFWAAMIRATRDLGASSHQGRAFGILDGGRGLVAAAAATFSVWMLGEGLAHATGLDLQAARQAALREVIGFYMALTIAAGICCWFWIPQSPRAATQKAQSGTFTALRSPVLWLQAGIVVCAYCGYKGIDNYALYARDVLQMNEVEAARFGAWSAYLRPVGAIAAGFLADRLRARHLIAALFAILGVVYLTLGTGSSVLPSAILVLNLLLSYLAVFALRGIYFALLEEAQVEKNATGAAVGVISVVGYTPDIFLGPIAGRILDHAPGAAGHGHYFLFLAVLGWGGLGCAVWLSRRIAQTEAVPGT